MRHALTLLALTALILPAAAQQRPGQGRGPGMALPEHWISWDSLAQALSLTESQLEGARTLHGQIDSLVRRGTVVRGEMRAEMQRNPDREQMQRFLQRLQTMQQRVDRLVNDLRGQLTDEQRTALGGLRNPMVVPPRPQGGRRPGT